VAGEGPDLVCFTQAFVQKCLWCLTVCRRWGVVKICQPLEIVGYHLGLSIVLLQLLSQISLVFSTVTSSVSELKHSGQLS
jgi:hypothetical protein